MVVERSALACIRHLAINKPLLIVPTLQRGNAACDAPASRNAGAFSNEFPRRASLPLS